MSTSGALWVAVAQGFGLGGGLIIAIGAQNAFVLRQGLRRRHAVPVATLCAVIDVALIGLGAVGFGSLIAAAPWAVTAAAWGGAAFLTAYGLRSFRAAWRGSERLTAAQGDGGGLRTALATAAAVSLLNPHVYLDTVILLGAVAATHPPTPRTAFAVGAMAASIVWFYGLAFLARALAPLLARPLAWRILDVLIGVIMLAIAAGLVVDQLM